MRFSASDQATLAEILRWRRDVRRFRPDPLPEAALAALRACLAHAPSVGNSRPWRVVSVESAAAREGVIESFEAANAAAAAAYDDETAAAYRRLKLAGLREAPTQLAFFTDLEPAEGRGLGRRTMPETLAYSTVMAVHTLWLTARARDIGVGWVSILDPQAVSRLLGAPPEWRLTAYLCLGYPEAPSDRPELAREGWQANTDNAGWTVR